MGRLFRTLCVVVEEEKRNPLGNSKNRNDARHDFSQATLNEDEYGMRCFQNNTMNFLLLYKKI